MNNSDRFRATIIKFFQTQSSKIDLDFENEFLSDDIQFILTFATLQGKKPIRDLFHEERDIWEGLAYHVNSENIIVEDNTAVVFWRMTGKQIKEFHKVPPSQNSISVDGFSVFKFNPQGKVREIKVQIDLMSLLLQIKGIELLYQ